MTVIASLWNETLIIRIVQQCVSTCYSSTTVLYGKKMFLAWIERSGSLTIKKHTWLFQSIGGLQQLHILLVFTNIAKNTSSITGGASKVKSYMYHGNHIHYIPWFLIVPPCTGLRWCPDAVIIFLIYLSIQISTVKHPKQNKWFIK